MNCSRIETQNTMNLLKQKKIHLYSRSFTDTCLYVNIYIERMNNFCIPTFRY